MKNIACAAMLLAATAAHAIPVDLVGGAVHPYQTGFVPVPPNLPQEFVAATVANISDGDDGTGFAFTSGAGEYSSHPLQTVGFQKRFDFDVSDFASVDRIDFTWTGRQEFGSALFGLHHGRVWISAGDGQLVNVFATGDDFGTDDLHTFSASFVRQTEGFDDIDLLLHGGLASIFLQTELGHTGGDPLLPWFTVDTREVRAEAFGTLRDPVGVPAPAGLPLMLAALGLLGLVGRRAI
jgi:hypothetical protein